MKTLDHLLLIACFLALGIILWIGYLFFCCLGNEINLGEGQYQGIIVETRHHGLFYKTYGVHLKTGENSSVFEDFCVTDKNLFDKISVVDKDKKIIIFYKKKLGTLPWQCDDRDSNDIVVDFKVVANTINSNK